MLFPKKIKLFCVYCLFWKTLNNKNMKQKEFY